MSSGNDSNNRSNSEDSLDNRNFLFRRSLRRQTFQPVLPLPEENILNRFLTTNSFVMDRGTVVGTLNTTYNCYSISHMPGVPKLFADFGGKMFLPSSALETMTKRNAVPPNPMLFKITNPKNNKFTHCGVLEFSSSDKSCNLPQWMMINLDIHEGDSIQVETVKLPTATFAKFEPQSVDFVQTADPKAILESALRGYACLTNNEIISIKYNDKVYQLRIADLKPGTGVTIIECDMDVEFMPAVGSENEQQEKIVEKNEKAEESQENKENFAGLANHYYPGQGQRIDGRPVSFEQSSENQNYHAPRGIPDKEWTIGKLNFMRNSNPAPSKNKQAVEAFKPFVGEGKLMKKDN